MAENAKHAQFRVMPRYKVKAEGDVVSYLYENVVSGLLFYYTVKPQYNIALNTT